MSKKETQEKNSNLITLTNDSGTNIQFDPDKASPEARGLYARALELKRNQVQIETALVENNILLNDYITRLMELLSSQEENNVKE